MTVLTAVSFDMCSSGFAAPTARLYGADIEMAVCADKTGVDGIDAGMDPILRTMPDGSTFASRPLLGGLDPAKGSKSLELLEKTIPWLQKRATAMETMR